MQQGAMVRRRGRGAGTPPRALCICTALVDHLRLRLHHTLVGVHHRRGGRVDARGAEDGGGGGGGLAAVEAELARQLDAVGRVQHVAVERSAREAEAPGHAERSIVCDPNLGHRHLDRRRKAAVEIEVLDLVDAEPSELERLTGCQPQRGTAVKVDPVRHEGRRGRVGGGDRKHPVLRRDPETPRGADRAQDDRRGLIDDHVRTHRLRIGPVDHPIVAVDPADRLLLEGFSSP